MENRPRLRPIEAVPVQQDGRTLVYLKDPLHLATPLGVSAAGYFIISHFDGQHSLLDVQEAYCRRFGALLMTEELKDLIAILDQRYYLISDRFVEHAARVIATELVCACQGLEFHRPLRTTAPLEGAVASVREMVPRVEEDRSLAEEIGRLADAIRIGALTL
jgi:hypothetical protein